MKANDIVISRTIMTYYNDRKWELSQLSIIYSTCTDIMLRREIRIRKKELIEILLKADAQVRSLLKFNLNITYKETKNYPELIEVKRKQMYLNNSLK